jgi:ATP-dependent protease ClpP protease subunit
MKSWYTIRARASGTEVLIYDEIGAYGVSAKGFLAELGALPGDAAIDLRLNSPGVGLDAVAIYNALKRHAGETSDRWDRAQRRAHRHGWRQSSCRKTPS